MKTQTYYSKQDLIQIHLYNQALVPIIHIYRQVIYFQVLIIYSIN